MNTMKVVKQLELKYPGKTIIKNNKSNPSEILCEIDPSNDHPEYSVAIAVIDKSEPHMHIESTETYKVIKGILDLYINGEKYTLKEDQEKVIKTNSQHWAEGKETWVECYSKPGWTLKDHIII